MVIKKEGVYKYVHRVLETKENRKIKKDINPLNFTTTEMMGKFQVIEKNREREQIIEDNKQKLEYI